MTPKDTHTDDTQQTDSDYDVEMMVLDNLLGQMRRAMWKASRNAEDSADQLEEMEGVTDGTVRYYRGKSKAYDEMRELVDETRREL